MSQVQEPAAGYARNKGIEPDGPTLFGSSQKKGVVSGIDPARYEPQRPGVYYSHPHGQIWLGDAVAWLRSLPSASADLAFCDPPYGIKKAEWDTFESQQEYVRWSLQWIEQAARVLQPTGTLYNLRLFGDFGRLEAARVRLLPGLPLACLALQEQGQPRQ